MQQITNIGTSASQTLTLPIGDGTTLTLTLTYAEQQTGWYYDLSWSGETPPFTVNGRRIVTTPNLLRHFKNKLPFGIACLTLNDVEPLNQTDFSDGTATLYLLNQADVGQVEMLAFPGNK